MTLKDKRDRETREALEVETRTLFPKIYEGYIEVDALAQGENAILRILRKEIYRYYQNRNLQTLNEEAIITLENGLGYTHTGTIEERRTAIIETINKRFVMNEAELAERIEKLGYGENIKFKIDSKTLKLEIYTENTEDPDEAEGLKDTFKAVLPIVPLNLEVSMDVITNNDIETNSSYGWTNALQSNIGEPAYVKGVTHYGYLTSTGEDISVGEIPMGNFTGGIVVKYDSNLKEVKADKGNFTGGIVVKYDSNLVQINIPMGYMQ